MSSKIKVDTIENVAGSGNVSLGSGHNLVVPGNITGSGDLIVDTNNLFVDASAEKVFVNRTTQTKNSDAFVVSSPAGGVGGGNNRVDMTVTAEDLTGDSGAHANAFVGTKAKGNYYSGLEMSSTSGHVGGWIGHWNGGATTRALEARVGGTGLNASDVGAMKINVDGQVLTPVQPSFKAHGNNNAYQSTSPMTFPTVSGNGAHNRGSHYNNSSGQFKFTCPVDGVYLFHVHVGIARTGANGSGGGNCYPQMMRNGGTWAYSYMNQDDTQYGTVHITAIWLMSANDYVQVAFSGSNADYYGGPTELTFQGCLLG